MFYLHITVESPPHHKNNDLWHCEALDNDIGQLSKLITAM